MRTRPKRSSSSGSPSLAKAPERKAGSSWRGAPSSPGASSGANPSGGSWTAARSKDRRGSAAGGTAGAPEPCAAAGPTALPADETVRSAPKPSDTANRAKPFGCAPPARRPQGEGPPGLEPAHPVRARRNAREAGVRRRRPAMIHEAPNPRAVFAGASRLLVRCGAGFWGAVMTRIGQRNRKGSGAGEDFLLRWSGRNRYAEAILEKSGVARRQDFAPFLLD